MSVRGKYGECVISDCIEYMKSFEDKTFDLGFTDPPWGHNYDGQKPMGINAQVYKGKNVNYDDHFDPEFNMQYFKELTRICSRVVLAMGWKHFNWWVSNTNPIGYFFLIFNNGQGQTEVCNHNAVHPLMCYGDFKKRDKKFHWNYIGSEIKTLNEFIHTYMKTYIPNGFLRNKRYTFIHPSPKPFKDWYKMINALNPVSLFDPFAGSCPIGEVGETLKIPWKGCEIKSDYIEDIQYRINCGISRSQRYNLVKKTNQKLLETK